MVITAEPVPKHITESRPFRLHRLPGHFFIASCFNHVGRDVRTALSYSKGSAVQPSPHSPRTFASALSRVLALAGSSIFFFLKNQLSDLFTSSIVDLPLAHLLCWFF